MFIQKEKIIIWQAILLKSIEEKYFNRDINFTKRMRLIKEINECFEEKEQNEFLRQFEKFLKRTPELSAFLAPLMNYIIKNKLIDTQSL